MFNIANYTEKLLILNEASTDLSKGTRSIPKRLHSKKYLYELDTAVLTMDEHFVSLKEQLRPLIYDDTDVSIHHIKKNLSKEEKQSENLNLDSYTNIRDNFTFWVLFYVAIKDLEDENFKQMYDEIIYVCNHGAFRASNIGVLTITQCNFILEHQDKFSEANPSRVKARITQLSTKQGPKKFVKQINNPMDFINKPATYEALMRQRRVLLDRTFKKEGNILIEEQIADDLLTKHVFPFETMVLTTDGNILVTWAKQLNDPIVAMSLNNEGLDLESVLKGVHFFKRYS